MKKTLICSVLILALLSCGFTSATAVEVPLTTKILGDVTGDGVVGADDALNVLKFIVGKPCSLHTVPSAGLMADTDGSGFIDSADALEMLQRVVGKQQQFTAESLPQAQRILCTAETDWYSAYRNKIAAQSMFLYPGEGNNQKYYHPIEATYGFGSAPGMVANLASLPSVNDMADWQALLFPAYNLQLNLHRCLQNYAYNSPKEPQNYSLGALTDQFLAFVGSVPAEVTAICEDETMTLEQQRERLCEFGLLALPFLQERIEQGETKWEICFADQLLGLPRATRLAVLQQCYDIEGWMGPTPTDPQWHAKVYTIKADNGLPVDVAAWCAANTDELTAIKNWCLATQSEK